MPLEDGSLFAYAGGKEPRVWFVTPTGQLERGFDIPAALQTKPVAMHGGMVLPMEGRLRYIPIKPGGPRVDDYTQKVTVNPPKNQKAPQWMHLERLDDDQLIAVDSANSLLRIQFRTDPVSHLFEARKLQLKSPVNVPFAVFEGVILLADADRQLHVLDGQTFQPLGSTALDGDATNALWMVDGRLYVETNRSELTAYEISPATEKTLVAVAGRQRLGGVAFVLGADASGRETKRGRVDRRCGHRHPAKPILRRPGPRPARLWSSAITSSPPASTAASINWKTCSPAANRRSFRVCGATKSVEGREGMMEDGG